MKITNIKLTETKDNIFDIVLVVEEAIMLSGIEAVYKDRAIKLNLPDNIKFINSADIKAFKKAILQDIECKLLCENKTITNYLDKTIDMIKNKRY